MNAYIEEGAWVSCSFDLAGKPQQLIRHLESEPNPVRYSSGDRLLTVVDKNTKKKFVCKSPAKAFGGLGALIGGIVGGLLIVASGPVGWALVAAVAAVTVAAAVGGAIGGIIVACNHDCAGPQSGGKWRSEHQKVLIKGEKPILYNKSVLECANGGFLIASESKPKAQVVSDEMKWQARGELGLQVLSNALIGVATGYGAIDDGGADLDLSTIPLEIASYYTTDIVRANADDEPLESAAIGAGFTAANFGLGSIYHAPGMPSWTRHLGTEFSKQDLVWAIFISAIGYGSDKGEQALNTSATEVIDSIEISQVDFSGRSIVATD